MDLPIENGGSFHSFLYVYQRVTPPQIEALKLPNDGAQACQVDDPESRWAKRRCNPRRKHGACHGKIMGKCWENMENKLYLVGG